MFARPLFALALMASSVLGVTHTINVAPNKSLTFEPAEVKAELGDVIEFKFLAGNHTVTQSTFAAPCTNAGFNSGQIPGNPDLPTSYSILVNDTKPIWVYCGTGQHCQNGMVMANVPSPFIMLLTSHVSQVNAPAEGNTFAAFQANAAGGGNATAAGNSTGSASSLPSGSSAPSAGVSGSASASATAADSSASASASSSNETSSASSDSSASSLNINFNFVPISLITLLALWFTLV
ncbi:hypothetical protein I302_100631 [Kwoniella bestiolae CBS 10118]|uniref:Phytocyanin domain-containing protein n=1 Tax=Kwoniella bestiolae CBS 10118 TaxID=1296100 RepID=A0A1B9G5P5_9TREE|nr:hypothetical protein I302_04005 [Kwoniella bestiolae CBS 10118]OCF26322.1 hypothetical protein I302_04005 [Kwoniella bestiolae CBS 10118]